ncbi:protein disulfide isomerase [Dacryopinax primogenitus]|uniref:Protein disulfide-isomerase n=1 Tax=Dacryopinax primogenitus (strain DJM 731) TaxID=1858805 RepID=M5GCX5_DACPD|nr:protein disulfide isomerase [Dacryopinax primogenitus]EJU06485.1 protein disulfide isomerase [Dacryopinax primogenitus]
MRALSLLLALSAFVQAEDTSASDVLSLTSESFSTIRTEPLVLVEFFAPWCGHCKALAPHYEEAATQLKEKGIKLAKVDCVAQGDLCQEYGVAGYPTLKVFRNGTPAEYAGNRKTEGIVSYMIKQSLPAVTDVTLAMHDEFTHEDRVVLIAYVESATAPPAPVFSAVAEAHRDDYLFGMSTNPAVASSAGVTPPAIVLYKKFDEGRDDLPSSGIESLEQEALEQWIEDKSVALFDEISGENYGKYAQAELPIAYVFLDPADEAVKARITESVTPLAKEFHGRVNFVWIDGNKFADHAKNLNVKEPHWPAFVIQDLKENSKFPLDPALPVDGTTMRELTAGFLDGSVKPTLKSQPIPESQEEDVYVLVTDEFDKIVNDEERDVFVEFYAPWCGHCKRLAPTWEALGQKFASHKDKILIAKMDATENDVPPSAGFQVQSFPTIKFKPAGGAFVDYEGDRSLESLEEFVEQRMRNRFTAASEGLLAKGAAQTVLAQEAAQTPLAQEGHDEL